MGDRDKTITAAEAARRLGISTRTLWRWAEQGRIRDAPRRGNYRMYYAEDVDALLRESRGVPNIPVMGTLETYRRLAEAQTWDDVRALKRDMARSICSHAEAEALGPLLESYKAATSMAATHPDEGARGRWREQAEEYGELLGICREEVDAAVRIKARPGSYTTYESAKAEAQAAPSDPAYEIAKNGTESEA